MQMLLGKKVLFHGQHALNVHLLQYSFFFFKKKKKTEMVPDTCVAFITKYIAIARIMESSVCNPFLLLGCQVAKPMQSINGGLIVCAPKRQ